MLDTSIPYPPIPWTCHPECEKCSLCQNVSSVGIGARGSENPKILFIGTAPGVYEDKENLGFVGEAGDILLSAVNLCITVPWTASTLVKCRSSRLDPASGLIVSSDPPPEAVDACRSYLLEEIRQFKPTVIVALGDFVLKKLMGKKYSLKIHRGYPLEHPSGITVIPTYHPSYLGQKRKSGISNSKLWDQFQADIEKADRTARGESTKINLKIHYLTADDPDFVVKLTALEKGLTEADIIGFDVETNSYEGTKVESAWHTGFHIISMAFAVSEEEAFVTTLYHPQSMLHEWQVTLLKERILPLLNTVKLVGHNIKYDLNTLKIEFGLTIPVREDTSLIHWCFNPALGKQSLENILLTYEPNLAKEKIKVSLWKSKIEKESYTVMPLDLLMTYNAYDAAGTLILYHHLMKELKYDESLMRFYKKAALPAAEVLKKIEEIGIVPDENAAITAEKENREKLKTLEEKLKKITKTFLMPSFNPNSSQQVAVLLYDKLGLPKGKITAKGKPSVDSTYILSLRSKADKEQLEVIDLLYSHIDKETGEKTDSIKGINKLLSTYLTTFKTYIGKDGRIHPSYNQTGTETGRISANSPNIQNQPKALRNLFKAPPGYLAAAADYSQAELRLLAVLSRDKNLLEIYRNNLDIHAETGKAIFKTDTLTAAQRTIAKNTNFGIVYGEGAAGLAERLSVSEKEAQGYIDRLYQRFPGIHSFIEERHREVEQTSKVNCPFGNIRKLENILSDHPADRGEALRQSVNSPIQGGIGVLVLHKMSRLAQIIDWKDCQMIVNLHDEIWFYIRKSDPVFWLKVIQSEMENMQSVKSDFDLDLTEIPFPVEVKLGENFRDMHPLESFLTTNSK